MRLAVSQSLEALESRLLAELADAAAAQAPLGRTSSGEAAGAISSTHAPAAAALLRGRSGPVRDDRALLSALRAQRDVLVKERTALAWLLQTQQRLARDTKQALETVVRTVRASATACQAGASSEPTRKRLEDELRSSRARLLASQRDRREAAARNEAMEAEVAQLHTIVSQLRAAQQRVHTELAVSREAVAQMERRAQASEVSAKAARATAESDIRRLQAAAHVVAASDRVRVEQADAAERAAQLIAEQAAAAAQDGVAQALAQHAADKAVLAVEVRSLRALLAAARAEAAEAKAGHEQGRQSLDTALAGVEALRRDTAEAETALTAAEGRAAASLSCLHAVTVDLSRLAEEFDEAAGDETSAGGAGGLGVTVASRPAASLSNRRSCGSRGGRVGTGTAACWPPRTTGGKGTRSACGCVVVPTSTPPTRVAQTPLAQPPALAIPDAGAGAEQVHATAAAWVGRLSQTLRWHKQELARAHAQRDSAEVRLGRAEARAEQRAAEVDEAREVAARASQAEAEAARERFRAEAALRQQNIELERARTGRCSGATAMAHAVPAAGGARPAPLTDTDASSQAAAQRVSLKIVTRELAATEAQLITVWAAGIPDPTGMGNRIVRAAPKALRTPAHLPARTPHAFVSTPLAPAGAAEASAPAGPILGQTANANQPDAAAGTPAAVTGQPTPITPGHSPAHDSLADFGRLRPKTALQRRLEHTDQAEAERRVAHADTLSREQAARRRAAREYAERIRKLSVVCGAARAPLDTMTCSGTGPSAPAPIAHRATSSVLADQARTVSQTVTAGLQTPETECNGGTEAERRGEAEGQGEGRDEAVGQAERRGEAERRGAQAPASGSVAPAAQSHQEVEHVLGAALTGIDPAQSRGCSSSSRRGSFSRVSRPPTCGVSVEALEAAEAAARRAEADASRLRVQLDESRRQLSQSRHTNDALRTAAGAARVRRDPDSGGEDQPVKGTQRASAASAAARKDSRRVADAARSELHDLQQQLGELRQALAESKGRAQTLQEALEHKEASGAASLDAALARAVSVEAELARLQHTQTDEAEAEAARTLREYQAQEVLQWQLRDARGAAVVAEALGNDLRAEATRAGARVIAVGTVLSMELLAMEGEMTRVRGVAAASAAEAEAYAAAVADLDTQLQQAETRVQEARRQGEAALIGLREQLVAAREAHAAAMASQREGGRKEWQGKVERLQEELRVEMATLAELPPPSPARHAALQLTHHHPPSRLYTPASPARGYSTRSPGDVRGGALSHWSHRTSPQSCTAASNDGGFDQLVEQLRDQLRHEARMPAARASALFSPPL